MNRVGYQTTIDGCHPVLCDKLDNHHHALNSQSLQHTKMPTLLLRLDSVGEVSTVKLPSNGTASDNKTTLSSRPGLRNSKSFDCDIATTRSTRRLLSSSSTMAKLLSPSKTYRNSLFTGSGQTESHGLDSKSSESGKFYGLKSFSSFDSSQTNSLLHNMNNIFTPSKINEYNLFGSQSHQAFKDLETILPPAVSCSLSSSIFSTIAAACTACRVASSGCSVSSSAQSTPLDKDSSSRASVLPEIPVTEALCQTCESNINMAPLSTYLEECAPDHSSLSIVTQSESKIDESSIKCDDVAAGENAWPVESVLNGECEQTEECSRSCDKLECDSSQNSTSNEASNSCLTSLADLSSVLSTPRKTTKKGRPSSKKQRKRQREKQKSCSVPLVSKLFMPSNEVEKIQHLSNCSQSEEDDDDSSSILFEVSESLDSTPRVSTPVKSQSKHCPIASFIFGGRSDSDDSDGDDICEDSHEWSASEDAKTYALPKKCAAFNAPLNLDTVFKRKIVPTLRSVFWAEDSESESESSPAASPRGRQSPTLDTSKDEHSEESSVEFSSPASSPSKSFGLTCGLSIEALFTKKPDLACPNAVKESICDTVDGVSSSFESCQLSTGFEMCCESIGRIAKWNESYPSAGFRSCLAISSDEIKDPTIKVHFASGPSFLTVHTIGTEERAGTWHHFALDRERFQRRILDLTSVLSPVLAAGHRDKVLSRNQQI